MDNNQSPKATPETPQVQPMPTSEPVVSKPQKNTSFFATVGKITLMGIPLALFLYGAYYLGYQSGRTTTPSSPTPTQTGMVSTTEPSPTLFVTPKPEFAMRSVRAGLTGSPVFHPYTIGLPAGWTEKLDTNPGAHIDKLTITKQKYSLTVYQAAFGGGGCLYKGDPENPMAQTFKNFIELSSKDAQFRRSWNERKIKTVAYTVCQKGSDGSYGDITAFGKIDVAAPNPPDEMILSELDSMISSLTKR